MSKPAYSLLVLGHVINVFSVDKALASGAVYVVSYYAIVQRQDDAREVHVSKEVATVELALIEGLAGLLNLLQK